MGSLVPREPRGRVLLAGILALGLGLSLLLAGASASALAGSAARTASSLAVGPRPESAPAGLPSAARDFCTVIFVRHAEKDPSGDSQDPRLGEAGRKRAAALARLLAPAGVSRLYASEYRRTQETLAPLAERTGKKVEILPAGDPQRMIAALASLPAGTVCVVAGHSNTIPALVVKLGGHVSRVSTTAQGPQLAESEFDRMFVVTLGPPDTSSGSTSRTAISTLELGYGDG
jgi:phosphohistidine phosphatase SixA